jgi:8-oxo-dGTP pyrophosphatase MutT (NUDIX family)
MSGGEPPVKRLARRMALENRVWRVDLDHIRDANGAEVRDYLVLTSKAHDAGEIGGVAVLPVLPDGRIVLLRNWRHAIGAWSWEVAKGFVDPGEAPAQAAARELAEETGLVCAAEDLVSLGPVYSEPAALATSVALFVAQDCHPAGGREPSPDEVGLGAPAPLTLAEIDALVRAGDVCDAVSLLLLARHAAGDGAGRTR